MNNFRKCQYIQNKRYICILLFNILIKDFFPYYLSTKKQIHEQFSLPHI